MLKASQKRTKRAALTEASMSRQPARTAGLLATMPMVATADSRKSHCRCEKLLFGVRNGHVGVVWCNYVGSTYRAFS